MLAVPAKRYPSEISNQKRGKELTEMDVVLETDCSLLKGKEFYPHRVILTNSKLICRPQGTKKNQGLVEICIQLKDVLLSNHHTHLKDCGKFKHEGSCMPCRFCKTSPSQINFQDESSSALLTVICFPYSKAVQDGGVRKKKELIFLFEGDVNHTENLQLVQDWSNNINNLCNARTNDLTRAEVGDATDYPLSSRRRKRKFLVCINPFSGPGNAKQIYSHEVKPVFQEADIEVEELVTIKQNHAREFARTVSYKDYDAVIIVSGDGLIFEWLNGIMERDDRDQAIKLPMGIIPAGSGNALATAMLVSKQEQCFKNSHLHSALLAAKGRPTPMDVVEVHYGDKKVYSFLAVAWGIISDIDIESEWLRFMGSPRFTIQAFIRIMALRKYRGILYYLPAEGYSQSSHSTQNGHVVGGGGNEGESSNHKAPLVNNTSVSVQAGDGILNPSFQSSESQESHDGSSESDSPTTQQPLLPPLSEPVPSNWVKVEGKFVCIVVLQDSHLSRDIVAWPNRAFNEGVMCIQYVMYPVSRKHLLDVMVEMGKGDHMEKNSVTSVFVKAFRIEPLEEDGIVTVDGEKVEFGPIQGQMMETKANILIPS